ILTAEAEKRSLILRSEAEKEAAIRRAEGEAESILKVQEATAQGLMKLNASNPTSAVLILKSYEALKEVADGKATKLIIPSDMQSIAGMAASLKEIITTKDA
ncbi:MAG TPA: peptidase, partial [Clostridiales bacterium]|nr:peptidase [Clostridiales bacterium]